MKYRKKPVVIEAVQLLWETWSEMCDHAGVGKLSDGKPEGCFLDESGHPNSESAVTSRLDIENGGRLGLMIPTSEGLMVATQDDWIIRGTVGELYACKPDAFAINYEAVDPLPVDPVAT